MPRPGQPWKSITEEHPPVNGTPVLVCLERKWLGSYIHVGSWNMTGNGVPLGVITGHFDCDLPKVLYWTEELPQLPWHLDWPNPHQSGDTRTW